MSTKNVTLHDENGNVLLPATKTSRVTDANGTNLDTLLQQAGQVKSISVNGVTQTIDANGNVNITSADGVGIASVVQTTTSSEDGGTNVITVTKTDNTTSTFSVKNGSKGSTGAQGERGPQGNTGVTVESVNSIIHSIDPTATYAAADVAGADAVQDVLAEVTELEGGIRDIAGGTIGIENFTVVQNTWYSKSSTTGVVTTGTTTNTDTYMIEWSKGGSIHVRIGGCSSNGKINDMMVGFFNSTTLSTETLIYSAHTNYSETTFETIIPIPDRTVKIIVCNRKKNLSTPTIEIIYDGTVNNTLANMSSHGNYGVEATTNIVLSNSTTLIDGFSVTAGHTYKITTRKALAASPNVTFAMGANDTVETLISDSDQITLFIPNTSSANCRLYSKSSVAANEYYWKIEDVTQPSTMPLIDTVQGDFLAPSDVVDNLNTDSASSPLSAKQGKLVGDYLFDKLAYYVHKEGQMPASTTAGITFVSGFKIIAGHNYRLRIRLSENINTTLKVGLGSNNTFSEIAAATDNTQWITQSKTATTSSDNSRIYFVYGTPLSSYPNAEIYLYDLTEPTTMPVNVISQGLETTLRQLIVNNSGGGGGSAKTTLHIGKLFSGLWSTSGRGSTVGLCTDKMLRPFTNMVIDVKLPEDLSCQIVTGGEGNMTAVSEWLNDGDTVRMSNSAYYAVNFADADDHTVCTKTVDAVTSMINSGAISLSIRNKDYSVIPYVYDSDRYVRRLLKTGNATIVHVSDIHGDRERYKHALDYADSIRASMVINTGDTVVYNWFDGCHFVLEDAFDHVTPVCTAMGNHDVISSSENVFYSTITQPLAEVYGYKHDANTDATHNYYYIDDTSKLIRYIVLMVYYGGSYDATQTEWFVDTLASTPSGYGVVVALHTLDKRGVADAFDYRAPNEFTNFNLRGIVDLFISGASGSVTVSGSNTVACDFTNADSNEFICWLGGHSHVDWIGHYDDTTNRQVVLQVDCTSAAQSLSYFARNIEGCTQDSFNIYQIDRTTHKILCMKVGANVTTSNTDVKFAEVSYIGG